MLTLTLDDAKRPLRTVLFLGAHCDDIEIGCGGTLLKLISQHPDLRVHWVVFSADPIRATEAQLSAGLFLKEAAERQVAIRQFRESLFPWEGRQIKEYLETLKGISPDLIFTHYRDDLHQDHAMISHLTWNTFRNHLILEYEIPKYDGDLGVPNLYVNLDESVCRRKIRHIMECYRSQRNKHWFTEDTFLALMRMRGIESDGGGRYAEAFYCRKMVL